MIADVSINLPSTSEVRGCDARLAALVLRGQPLLTPRSPLACWR
jgi:hypothetical protein